MQQSFLALFCDECGLANDPAATRCSACQSPLIRRSSVSEPPALAPVAIPARPVGEVTPGQLFATDAQSGPDEIGPGSILAECYLLKEEIGRGGFSIVYRAVEVDDQRRQVAIKRIPLSALAPGQVIDATETFNREIAMLTRCEGLRGVPKFYGHLTDQANWYLVMEYIAGETLEDMLQNAPGGYLDEAKAVRIGAQLAHILYELHTYQPPVIFRDVKPANIMLTPNNEIFLIDFGIARTFRWGKARDTTALGSPGYAAPEQYGRAQTDRRADIYALGATLQTLVTGREPLELAAGEAPRNPKPLSPELRAFLDQMLQSDPYGRPVDMRHVQTRLESIVPWRKPIHKIDYKSDPDYQNARLGVASLLFIVISGLAFITSTWLGIIFLALLALTIGVYGKWAEKLPTIGQFVIAIGRQIVTYSWLLFILLWLVVWLLPTAFHLP